MRSKAQPERQKSSLSKIRSISRNDSRRSSVGSNENSAGQSAKDIKKAEKRPTYYILDNCYLCTWGPVRTSSQTQAGVVFFATGELVLGYLQLKNKSLVFSGPMFMVSPSGSVLLCECNEGLLEGVGLLRMANGDVVIGEWKEGLKHGSTVSYNIESNKKVYATFKKGEVKILDRTDQQSIVVQGKLLLLRS